MKINLDLNNFNEKDFEKIFKENSKLLAQFNKYNFTILDNKLLETIEKFNKQTKIFNENLLKPIVPNYQIPKINFSVYENFKAIEKINESFKSLNRIIENVFKPLSTVLNDLFKNIEKLEEKGKQEVISLIYTYMWAIPPNFAPDKLKELVFLSALNIEVSQEDIDEFFIEYFKCNNFKELWRFFDIWKYHLNEERRKIISDIFTLVSNSNIKVKNIYSIVIPALIAQIDGLIVDKLGYRANSKGKREKVEEFLNTFLEKNVSDDFAKEYLFINFKIFAEKFFQNSDEAERESNNFNRHLIMHGNITNYGIEANLYRTIVILDFIITVLYVEDIYLEIF